MKRVLILLGILAGCDPGGPSLNVSDTGTSPNPSVQPLETATSHPADAGPPTTRDGGDATTFVRDAAPPPPVPFDPYERLTADRLLTREVTGVVLKARWRWPKVPGPAKAPHVNNKAIETARTEADGSLRVALSALGRMRIDFNTRGLPLPRGSSLLSRVERYGHVVVWPDDSRYRVIVPGALRATLGERRVDVSPLSRGRLSTHKAAERLGFDTRKVELRTPVGGATLELATIPESGRGAPLLCRVLVEMAGVNPSSELCAEKSVVLWAELTWAKDAGSLGFEVTEVERKVDLPALQFQLPPARARHTATGLPSLKRVFFNADELAAFRTDAAAPPDPPDPAAPAQGLTAENRSDSLLYLLLDGVPVAAVSPWARTSVPGPLHGRYSVQWRSFLGDVVTDAAERDLPAHIVHGAPAKPGLEPDAGK